MQMYTIGHLLGIFMRTFWGPGCIIQKQWAKRMPQFFWKVEESLGKNTEGSYVSTLAMDSMIQRNTFMVIYSGSACTARRPLSKAPDSHNLAPHNNSLKQHAHFLFPEIYAINSHQCTIAQGIIYHCHYWPSP